MAAEMLLRKAFELAYFLHGDREIARRVAVDAAGLLEVTATAQVKRLYYSAASRTKVSLGDLHLLQRLVYVASEPYELASERENPGRLTERDLIARFVKHLVRITVKRSSFYATLGVSRVLHAYNTPETAELYAVVVQNPDRVRDEAYFRARKKVLMQEMTKRFGDALRVARGPRGEERFEHGERSEWRIAFARTCLDRFTLWDTACRIPRDFAPLEHRLAAFAYTDTSADNESEVEVHRLHAVLHPSCFDRLAAALGLDAPAAKIDLPRFHLAVRDGGSDDHTPPRLADDELATMAAALSSRAATRKALAAGSLAVMVDGNLRATLVAGAPARVDVDGDAELIEVRARAEDVPLATLLLERDGAGDNLRPARAAVELEGGQKIAFEVVPNESGGASVEVAYREPATAAAFVRRLAGLAAAPGAAWSIARPALALGLLVAVGYAGYVALNPTPGPPALVTTETPRPAEPPAPSPPAPPPVVEKTAPVPADEVAGHGVASPGRHGAASPGRHGVASPGRNGNVDDATRPNVTRGEQEAWTAARLAEVKTIHVDPLGDGAEAAAVRDAIVAELKRSGRFAVAAERDSADAVMKGAVTAGQKGPRVALRLVNADGEVIWPVGGATWTGATDATPRAVADLVDAAQR